MIRTFSHLLKKILLTVMVVFFAALPASAMLNAIGKISADDLNRLRADSWRAVGKNMIIEGNVHLPIGEIELFADKVIINIEDSDFEALGNVRILCWKDETIPVTIERLAELEKRNDILIKNISLNTTIWGKREYSADVQYRTDAITGDRVSGNLKTGFFRIDNMTLVYSGMKCKAKSAERRSGGEIILNDADISTCSYMEFDNAHYSIYAPQVRITPHDAPFREMKYADNDKGDRSIFLYNGLVKFHGVPLIWLPVFYKPKDESPGLCGFQWGKSGDWGYYINLYRYFQLMDAPYFRVKVLADWYEQRGFGYGATGEIRTEESKTEFRVYSIYDKDPYETDDYDDYRLDVPGKRYDFRISNVTHITPRLDFRGVFEYQSDFYVRNDFFTVEYNRNEQPATYFSFEQQFDNFSISAYARFQVNDFYTTVEKLPELRMDIPRQEIFDSGIYYQGDFSLANMHMKWIKFDIKPRNGSILNNYHAARFDTTHFLYYPIRTRFFTLVPRAGFKATAYSNSSKHKVSTEELVSMFQAADPEGMGNIRFTGYDDHGSSKLRLAAELGFELSTKIHNTWQNVRSDFLEIDGLRHILQPYINYTFITSPTVKAEKLLYFDDIDRISKQNFVRLGMINRLQTRNDNSIRSLLTMENYWDIHLSKSEGMGNFGNLGTIISMNLLKDLTLNTEFLIDVDNDEEIERDEDKHDGLSLKWLNMWTLSLNYNPAKNWSFSAGYEYIRPYKARSAYSMGSTLTQINSASYFQRYYDSDEESVFFKVSMPLTPDHRTLGMFAFYYDISEGGTDDIMLAITRQFHCWQLTATIGFEHDNDPGRGDKRWELEYSISAGLTGLGSSLDETQNSVLRKMKQLGN